MRVPIYLRAVWTTRMSSTKTMDVVAAGAGHVARNTVGITTIQQRARSFLPRKIITTLVAVGRSLDLSRRSSVKGVIVVIVGRGGRDPMV
jgi:hypothetical protein